MVQQAESEGWAVEICREIREYPKAKLLVWLPHKGIAILYARDEQTALACVTDIPKPDPRTPAELALIMLNAVNRTAGKNILNYAPFSQDDRTSKSINQMRFRIVEHF